MTITRARSLSSSVRKRVSTSSTRRSRRSSSPREAVFLQTKITTSRSAILSIPALMPALPILMISERISRWSPLSRWAVSYPSPNAISSPMLLSTEPDTMIPTIMTSSSLTSRSRLCSRMPRSFPRPITITRSTDLSLLSIPNPPTTVMLLRLSSADGPLWLKQVSSLPMISKQSAPDSFPISTRSMREMLILLSPR